MAESIVRLKVDSSEYDSKLKRASEGLTRYIEGCRKVGGTLEVVEADTLKYVQALGQMETKSTTAKGRISEMSKAFMDLSVQYRQLSENEKSSPFGQSLGNSLNELKNRIIDAKKEVNDIGKSIGNIPTGTKKVGGSGLLTGLNDAISASQGGIEGLLGTLGRFGPQAAAIGGIGAAVVGVGSAAVGARKNLENLELNIGTLLGSAEKGKALVKDLQQYGVATSYDTAGLAEAARTMLSYGVNAEQIMPLMQQLGDVAQGDAVRLNSLALAFGQMTAVGTVQKQDLNQMANAGFGFNEIAKSMGVSVAEFLDMVSKKKVSVSDIAKALKDATSEGGLFYNSAKNASQGLEGTFSNFEESLEMTKAQLGKLIEPAVLQVVSTLGDEISKVTSNLGQAQAIGSAFSAVGSTISIVLKTVIEVGGAVAKAVGSIIEAFSKLLDLGGIDLLDGITKSIRMLLSPITGVANLISETIDKIKGGSSEAVEAISEVSEAGREESKVEKQRREDQDAVAKSAAGVVAQYNQLKKEWDSLKGSVEQTKWIKKHASDFNELGMTVNSVNDAYSYFVKNSARVVKALEAMARAEALKDLYKKAYQEQYEQEHAPGSVARGDYYLVHKEGERLQAGDYDRYGLGQGDIYNKPGEVGQFLNASGVAKANAYESSAAKARLNANLSPARTRTQRILADMNSAEAEAEEASAGLNLNPGGGMSQPGHHTKKTPKGKTNHVETAADRAVTAQGYYDNVAQKASELEKQMQEKISANTIAAMDEGTQKQLAEIEVNRKKELDALEKSVTDLAKQEKDADKKAWLKKHPKSGEADYVKTQKGQMSDADWQNYVLKMKTADGILGDIIDKTKNSINLKFDKQIDNLGIGGLKELNTQLQELTTKRSLTKTNEEWNKFDEEITEVQKKINELSRRNYSKLTTSNISGYISSLQQQLSQVTAGGLDYSKLLDKEAFATAFQNLLKEGLQDGADYTDIDAEGLWQKILSGDDPEGVKTALSFMLGQINDARGFKGLGDMSLDSSGGLQEMEKPDEQDGMKSVTEKADRVIGAMSQLTGGLQSMGIKIPDGVTKLLNFGQGLIQVIQAVQTIISIFSTSTAVAQTTATNLNTGALIGVTSALAANSATNLIPFARGGIVRAAGGHMFGGNNFSGDLIPAAVNSGELILNRAQQGNVASQLEGMGTLNNLSLSTEVNGETLRFVLNANGRRTGRGEMVTTNIKLW